MPSAMENPSVSSPKFITCPDCGERYDNLHKRRLIDTCGHPRCYSCLFVDTPCPLCQKLPQAPKPRSSSFHTKDESDSEESINASSESLDADQGSKSLGDISKLHKERAATLPARGFRTDNYFRSLYRYDPHATDNANGKNTKERPRSVPNYHKSLENLSDQFWKSVERASSPLGKGARSPSPLLKNEESPPSSIRSSTDDVTSNHTKLAVPGQTRTRSSTEIVKVSEFVDEGTNLSALRAEVLQKLQISDSRPRSQSDFLPRKSDVSRDNRDVNEVHTEEPASLSPNHFYRDSGIYGVDSDRGRPASDRSSDTSLPFSDSCSESSGDSDHLGVGGPYTQGPRGILKRWSYDENQNERLRVAEERLMYGFTKPKELSEQRKKTTKNPLHNVIHWVVEPPPQTEQSNTESALPKRPEPPKRGESSKNISLRAKSGSATAL